MTADVDKRITLIGGGADRVTVRAGDHVIGMLWGAWLCSLHGNQ